MAIPSTFEISALEECRYFLEAQTAYAQNVSGTQAYTFLKILDGSKFEHTKESLVNNTVKQRVDAWELNVVGRRRCKATLNMFLNGTGTGLITGSSTTPHGAAVMLQTVMGGRYCQTGSNVASGAGTGSVVVTANQGGNFVVGQSIAFLNPTTNTLEATHIGSITTDTLTFTAPLSFTPGVGSAVFGSHTCYLTQNPTASIQLFAKGVYSTDTFVLCGLQGGLALNTAFGQLPTMTLNLEGAAWFTGAASQGLSNQSITDAQPPAFIGSEVLLFTGSAGNNTVGAPRTGSTGINIPMKDIKFTPQIKYQDVMGAGGDNILAKRRSRNNPSMKIDLTPYFDLEMFRARDNYALYSFQAQFGNQPGNTVVIACDRCQIVAVDRGDNDGLTGITVTLAAQDVRGGVPSTGQTEIWESPFIVSFL